jgi:hypothetical protein
MTPIETFLTFGQPWPAIICMVAAVGFSFAAIYGRE